MTFRRISREHILLFAKELKIPPDTVELDYAQNWILFGISQSSLLDVVAFKGGTCLRKVYFKDYRFSKDLDFTLLQDISDDEFKKFINDSISIATNACGVKFYIDEINISDQTLFIKIKWKSLLSERDRKLEINITLFGKEYLTKRYKRKKVIHDPYINVEQDYNTEIFCYTLEEILSEKIRTLFERGGGSGAWPRDLYDVWMLTRTNYDKELMLDILKKKIQFKGINVDPELLKIRKEILENSWDSSLENLIPHKELPEFSLVFQKVLDFVIYLKEEIT